MKIFLQIPVHYLRDLPDVNLIEILKQANYFGKILRLQVSYNVSF